MFVFAGRHIKHVQICGYGTSAVEELSIDELHAVLHFCLGQMLRHLICWIVHILDLLKFHAFVRHLFLYP